MAVTFMVTISSSLDKIHCNRKFMLPSKASMIQNVGKIFGVELKRIVDRESCITNPHHGGKFFLSSKNRPPATPCREKNRRSFCFGESPLFGGCKMTILDWNLTEAIEQVHSLRDETPQRSEFSKNMLCS